MNIKLRLLNPATLIPLITTAIALVYEILAICGVTPWITQDELVNVITEIVTVVFTLLAGLGIVVDPTTSGVSDSELAKTYLVPYADHVMTNEGEYLESEFASEETATADCAEE